MMMMLLLAPLLDAVKTTKALQSAEMPSAPLSTARIQAQIYIIVGDTR